MAMFKNMPVSITKMLWPLLAFLCLLPLINPALALVIGVVCAVILPNPYQNKIEKLPKKLLPLCVIGLGAGMNLFDVLQAGISGFGYTVISIVLTLATGVIAMRFLQIERHTGLLITIGTAICGGSAIAAAAPVLKAKSESIAISLAVVFVLNALALMLLPAIGHMLEMSQHHFGLWVALAIHDTSSVVGAGALYGDEALQTGTSVKLARALWIVPLVLILPYILKNDGVQDGGRGEPKYPWFILGFLALAAVVSFVPTLSGAGALIAFAASRMLVVTLFLIGASINIDVIKTVGVKPFIFGVLLWGLVTVSSLAAIEFALIR